MDLGLKNKIVLVTGSTKGIGKAIAKNFLLEGAVVIINGRSKNDLEKTIDELSKFGTLYGIRADLGNASDTEILINKIQAIGIVDVLINNAGIFAAKNFTAITDEEWIKYFNINLLSSVRLCRYFLPRMLKRNSGRIINIASEAGVKPVPEMIHYSVTKTALISLSRGMAELTKGSNVTVNTVLPGPTWTDGAKEFIKKTARREKVSIEAMTKLYFDKYEPTSLIQRFATTDEVANGVLFLSSDLSSAINGSAQRIEGGIVRHI
jgi:NAD(P)-dependent dehydrogenase (short-subunit alcohol dehydrogenase family)